MISITSLWLPILLSAVFVFIISSIFHTVLTYHKSDYGELPNEGEIAEGLQKFNIPPGDYVTPKPASSAEMETEEYKAKLDKGPVAFITIMPNGSWGLMESLIQWFIYSLLVGVFVAYVTGRMLAPGADYLIVFRIAGTTSFLAYSIALLQDSIWFKRKWSTTVKFVFDGLIYALLTAGTFGWLWP
jgi:hypothetical protein